MKKRVCTLFLVLALLLTPVSALSAEQAGALLQDYYIDEIPEEILALGSVEEMLQALGDPYTTYYDADEYAAFLASLEDTELVGIGIVAYYLEEGILVSQTAPDSPARNAGIQPGDYIIEVDGYNVCGAAEEEIDSRLRGEEGTSVQLCVRRGEETFQRTVIRAHVVFPTVELIMIENGVGWISCSAFGSSTCQHFYDIITAHEEEVEQWVIDLRGNGGGDIYAAVYSAGLFAGDGSGVYLRDGSGSYYGYVYDLDTALSSGYCNGERNKFYKNGYLTEKPVYVLTDGNSASASELFCSAIRDSGAGLIIGGRTFGKGVAQTMLSGSRYGLSDGEAIKITTERGYSMAGATYDKVGILPHVMVDPALADEVAAILAAPFQADEDVLILRNVSSSGNLVADLGLPMRLLRAPENALVTAHLLAQMPSSVSYQRMQDGQITDITAEQAAAACGVLPVQAKFTDIQDSEYPQKIETLGRYQIIHGMGDGTYQPQAELNRASLCALLVKAMHFPVSSVEFTAFADVTPDDWYAPYVAAMYEMGLINGYNGYFNPNDPITHEQFLTILGRVAKWLDMDYYELSLHDGLYGDCMPDAETLAEQYGTYAEWARELIWLCDEELLWEPLEGIDPMETTTREEAAASVYNLLRESGALPG